VLLTPLWRPLVAIDAAAAAAADEVELLQHLEVFAPLPVPELERLAKALAPAVVEAGGTVFAQGDRGDHFYVIRGGTADVEVDGERVRTLGPGDSFGEIALVHDVPRTATVRAQAELELLALDRDVFVSTLTHHPASAQAAGSIIAARLASPVIA
jgi:CRP-like cAMP-binding protein